MRELPPIKTPSNFMAATSWLKTRISPGRRGKGRSSGPDTWTSCTAWPLSRKSGELVHQTGYSGIGLKDTRTAPPGSGGGRPKPHADNTIEGICSE